MKFQWKELLEKKNVLFVIGLAGILLIGLSEVLGSGGKKQASAPTEGSAASVYDRESALERRLETMLASVQGVGRVQVMITLEGEGETVYAQDEQRDESSQESADGTVQSKNSRQSEHIIYDSSDGKQPLVETRIEPEVQGVAVICEGGGEISVIKRVTELVSVVLDVPTNRVCVTKMS